MRVFRALKRQVSKSIKVLKKHFGAPATIYFPLEFNNKQHGYFDENITYDEGRDVEKVLIPALFRKQNQTLALLDSFYDPGEMALFEENHIIWPKYAKIVVRFEGAVRNFIINEIEEIKDDEVSDKADVIFRKYILVPSNSIDIEKNRDQLIDALNTKELAHEPGDAEMPPEESVTDNGSPTDVPNITVNRIK